MNGGGPGFSSGEEVATVIKDVWSDFFLVPASIGIHNFLFRELRRMGAEPDLARGKKEGRSSCCHKRCCLFFLLVLASNCIH